MGIILGSDVEQAANLRDWNTPNAIVPVVVGYNVNVTPIATLIARNKACIRMYELIGGCKMASSSRSARSQGHKAHICHVRSVDGHASREGQEKTFMDKSRDAEESLCSSISRRTMKNPSIRFRSTIHWARSDHRPGVFLGRMVLAILASSSFQ